LRQRCGGPWAASAEPDPVATLDHLAELADQSLLEVTAGEIPGFRMLQTVREYALARLAETGELDTLSATIAQALAELPRQEPALGVQTAPGGG
jgi:predicted ATPase